MGWFSRSRSFADLVAKANEMRRFPTPAEAKMLNALTDAFGRTSFKNQRIIGGYIVDFVFLDQALVIEVDGAVHDGILARFRDAGRDDYLRSRDFYVLHVRNDDVFRQIDTVIAEITRLLQRRSTRFGRLFGGSRRF